MSSSTSVDGRFGTDSAAAFVDPGERLRAIQHIVGRKWQPVIVYYLLEEESLRFSALKDRIDGISSKMLSESLDTLEEADIVERRLLSDQPVRVAYSLTERGRELEPVVFSMVEWAVEHEDAVPTEP